MTWRVEGPIRFQGISLAVIVAQEVSVQASRKSVRARAFKTPLVAVVKNADGIYGLDLQGRRLTASEIERRHPGSLATFTDTSDRA